MKIIEIKTHNFKALKGDRVYSPGEGLIGIVGPNGSGKSTIANAIAWCLYGPEVLPTGKQDVITWGEKESYVEISFDILSTRYRVRRWQGRPPLGGARIDSEAGSVAEGLQPTLRAVEALMGSERVGFLSSVFSRQEELSALSSLTPANRMKTVLRLLGVEELNGAIEHARTLSRDQSKTIVTTRSNLGDTTEIELALDNHRTWVIELNDKIDELEHRLDKQSLKSIELKDRMSTLSTKITEYNSYKGRKAQAQADIESSLNTLRGLLDFAGKIQIMPPIEKPVEPDLDELSTLKGDLNFFSRRLDKIANELKTNSTECPVCHRPYDNEQQLKEHGIELANEESDLMLRSDMTKASIASMEEELKAWESWREYEKARAEQAMEFSRVREAIFRAYDIYRQAQLDSNLIISPQDVSSDIEQIQTDAQEIERDKNDLSISLAVYKERLASTSKETERLESELVGQQALERLLEHQEHTQKVYETALKELIALKEKIIASAIPAIESHASVLLSEMTGGVYTELTLSPDYDIRYRNNLGEIKEYANLSGGERDVFALALRLALSELRADRIGILFLDEVLESLDDDRQELVWQSLERLTKRYQQIFIVTHVEKFRDRMPLLP